MLLVLMSWKSEGRGVIGVSRAACLFHPCLELSLVSVLNSPSGHATMCSIASLMWSQANVQRNRGIPSRHSFITVECGGARDFRIVFGRALLRKNVAGLK